MAKKVKALPSPVPKNRTTRTDQGGTKKKELELRRLRVRELIILGKQPHQIIDILHDEGYKVGRTQLWSDMVEIKKEHVAGAEKLRKGFDISDFLLRRLESIEVRRDKLYSKIKDNESADGNGFVVAACVAQLGKLDEIEQDMMERLGLDLSKPIARSQRVTVHWKAPVNPAAKDTKQPARK